MSRKGREVGLDLCPDPNQNGSANSLRLSVSAIAFSQALPEKLDIQHGFSSDGFSLGDCREELPGIEDYLNGQLVQLGMDAAVHGGILDAPPAGDLHSELDDYRVGEMRELAR